MMITKKLIGTLALTAALLLCTACTAAPEATGGAPESSAGGTSGEGAVTDGNSEASEGAYAAVYGKISSIAGNELDLSLAKDPYADLAPQGGGGDGDTVAAVETMPAAPAGEGDAGEDAAPKMQLDYTGETQSYTVPAGVKITKANGGEGQLSDLTKGSVLLLLTDNGSITEIMVLE